MLALLLIGMLAADNSVSFAHPVKADQVVVVKSQRTLTLLSQGQGDSHLQSCSVRVFELRCGSSWSRVTRDRAL
jgi:hypothetical protein